MEQASAELQQCTSALEGRLAELEHWELEAQEVCLLLKDMERRGQQGHNLKTKVRPASDFLVHTAKQCYVCECEVKSEGPRCTQ